MFTSVRRTAAAVMAGAVVAVMTSPTAAAHVDATLDGAGPGGFGVVTLGVPTETGKPATTSVEVRIPDGTPMRTVRPKPLAGWKIDITKRTIDPPLFKDDGTAVTEVVDTVTWTATGSGIPTGQFEQFSLYAGPLPDAEVLTLPTTQTFADGTTEAWAEPPGVGGEKPKLPAPAATIAKDAGSMLPIVAWSALGMAVIALGLAVFGIDRASRRSTAADPANAALITPAPVDQ